MHEIEFWQFTPIYLLEVIWLLCAANCIWLSHAAYGNGLANNRNLFVVKINAEKHFTQPLNDYFLWKIVQFFLELLVNSSQFEVKFRIRDEISLCLRIAQRKSLCFNAQKNLVAKARLNDSEM